MHRIFLAAFLVGAGFLLTFMLAHRPAVQGPAPAPGPGAAVFREACASCHGPQGEGMAGLAPPMRGRNLSVAEVKEIVQKGRGRMPPLPGVRGEALENVARFVSEMR